MIVQLCDLILLEETRLLLRTSRDQIDRGYLSFCITREAS
jgi:hypothetical protein